MSQPNRYGVGSTSPHSYVMPGSQRPRKVSKRRQTPMPFVDRIAWIPAQRSKKMMQPSMLPSAFQRGNRASNWSRPLMLTMSSISNEPSARSET